MKFLNEKEAKQCWQQLYLFHGAEPGTEEEFAIWKLENEVEYLDAELAEWIEGGCR